jgi:hypothetical protein
MSFVPSHRKRLPQGNSAETPNAILDIRAADPSLGIAQFGPIVRVFLHGERHGRPSGLADKSRRHNHPPSAWHGYTVSGQK